MSNQHSGEFNFARVSVVANPEIVTEHLTPNTLASFTAGWRAEEHGGLLTTDVNTLIWQGMHDYYTRRLTGVYVPRVIRDCLPGIGIERIAVMPEETAELSELLHSWPQFTGKQGAMYLRMDQLWTPSTDLPLEPPIAAPQATSETLPVQITDDPQAATLLDHGLAA